MNKHIKTVSTILNTYSNIDNKDIFVNGLNWYYDANKVLNTMSLKYGISLDKTAQICAVLSPSTNWQQNLKDTEKMIFAFVAGNDINSFTATTYGQNKLKAWHILQDKIELEQKSLKTFSFYQNLMLDSNYVTLDIWVNRMLNLDKQYFTPKQYKDITNCFLIAGKELSLKAFELQSILWCDIRKSHL